MFGVKTKNKTKEIAVFQVTRLIKYTSLKYRLYKSQNVKMDYKINIVDEIMTLFKTKPIFNKNWIRENNVCINMLLIKNYIRN